MADNDTLLANIIPRLTPRLENAAVESLGYILGKSQASRAELNNLARKGGAVLPPINAVRTEVSRQAGEQVTRPDLVGFDADNKERLLIEAKFWAGLTGDQVNRYLGRLPTDGPAALLFLAPEARMETLWPELRYRVEEAGKGLDPKVDVPAGMRGAVVTDAERNATNQHLMLVSWRSLLLDLHAAAERAMETSGITEDIRQLHGLTELMDSKEFLPFHKEDFNPAFARRLIDLRSVYDSCIGNWQGKDWVQDDRRGGADRTGYGRYLRLAGHPTWFGLFYQPWAAGNGETPFWIQLWGLRQHSPAIFNRVADELRLSDRVVDGSYLPIYVKTGVGQEEVVNDMLAQFKAIADAIQKFTAAESS